MRFLKYLNIVSLLWIFFLLLQFSLSGKWWVWNFFSIIPPFFLLLCTGLLIAAFLIGLASKAFQLEKKILYILPALLLCFIPVLQVADLNINTYSNNDSNAQEDFKIFNWNTRFWNEDFNESEIISFLKKQDADVYQLQEFIKESGELISTTATLEAFPDYEINVQGELLTLSRLPIVETFDNTQDEFLRTDIEIEGEIISFYNVHIPVHIFRNNEQMTALHSWRIEEMEKLEKELKRNTKPFVVSGDFNTTSSMGLMSPLHKITNDSSKVSTEILPATWEILGLKLWRIDYVLNSKDDLKPISYQTEKPGTLSDHHGISVGYTVEN